MSWRMFMFASTSNMLTLMLEFSIYAPSNTSVSRYFLMSAEPLKPVMRRFLTVSVIEGGVLRRVKMSRLVYGFYILQVHVV